MRTPFVVATLFVVAGCSGSSSSAPNVTTTPSTTADTATTTANPTTSGETGPVASAISEPPSTTDSLTLSTGPPATRQPRQRNWQLPEGYTHVKAADVANVSTPETRGDMGEFGMQMTPDGALITYADYPPEAWVVEDEEKRRIPTPSDAGPVVHVAASEDHIVLVTDPSRDLVMQEWTVWAWDRQVEELRKLMQAPVGPDGSVYPAPRVLPSVYDDTVVWAGATDPEGGATYAVELPEGEVQTVVEQVYNPIITEAGMFGITADEARVVRISDDGALTPLPIDHRIAHLAATEQGDVLAREGDGRTAFLYEPTTDEVTTFEPPEKINWLTGGDAAFAFYDSKYSYALDIRNRRLITLGHRPNAAYGAITGRWTVWWDRNPEDPHADGLPPITKFGSLDNSPAASE